MNSFRIVNYRKKRACMIHKSESFLSFLAGYSNFYIVRQREENFTAENLVGILLRGIYIVKKIPVILSGGTGTRLWPLSRKELPKQFLGVASEKTMIQETVLRLRYMDFSDPIVVCNESYTSIVYEQLRDIQVDSPYVISEPERRNSGPAVASAAFLAESFDTDSVIVVFPSDHVIRDAKNLAKAMEEGCRLAGLDKMVTLGVKPTYPETGYGYMEIYPESSDNTCYKLKTFVEKPDEKTAASLIQKGNYFWSSGIFIFKAKVFLSELEKYSNEIYKNMKKAFSKATREDHCLRLESESFKKIPFCSIDHAVMEYTDRGMVVPLDAGWSDIGSWHALWDYQDKDSNNNVLLGDILALDTKESYILGKNRLVVGVGLKDIVIVETEDVVLVANKNRVQDVKKIVEELERKKHPATN